MQGPAPVGRGARRFERGVVALERGMAAFIGYFTNYLTNMIRLVLSR